MFKPSIAIFQDFNTEYQCYSTVASNEKVVFVNWILVILKEEQSSVLFEYS